MARVEPPGRNRADAGQTQEETPAEALEGLVEGAARVVVTRVAPLTAQGYCGQTVIRDTPGAAAQLVEDVRQAYGGGRYQLRPLRPDGRFGRGAVTVEIVGEPRTHASPPAVVHENSAPWDLLRDLVKQPPSAAAAGAQTPDLQTLLALLRAPAPAPAPVDLTSLLTALISQQDKRTDPLSGVRELLGLLQEREAPASQPSTPEDRISRMMEMMFMSKMMGGMGMPGMPGGMPGMPGGMPGMPGGMPGARQQARSPAPAAAPAPAPEAAEAEDFLPNPAQLVGELSAMEPHERNAYLESVAAHLAAAGFLPNPPSSASTPPPTSAAPPGVKMTGGGWDG